MSSWFRAALFCGLTIVTHAAAQTRTPLSIESVSAPPAFISGPTVLLRVQGAAAKPQVTLNGRDVSAAFKADGEGRFSGVVSDLKPGDNSVEAKAGTASARLALRDHPITGPMLSGPHLAPMVCQTADFKLPDGSVLGPALDADCSAPTRVTYMYKQKGSDKFAALSDPAAVPADADVAANLDGVTQPFIVRVETGTINRAIYQIAVLHNPSIDGAIGPRNPPKGWARRLLSIHGAGCPRGWYIQGGAMGANVLDMERLGAGFALFTSTLNHPSNNCNYVLAAETTVMVRQRVIETLGAPLYTLTQGGSGGSYTSLQIADAFPGLFDGVLVNSTFPDALAIAIPALDARLLSHYFREIAPGALTPAQQQAIGGYGQASGMDVSGGQSGRTDPVPNRKDMPGYASALWSPAVPEALRYDPVKTPRGLRPTVFDVAANVYGRDPATGFAKRPYDNIGVQYGLDALNAGVISPAQFIDLNARVGGYDADTNYVAGRTTGDAGAIANAYAGGLVLSGSAGLKSLPVLDYTGIYPDLAPKGDFHFKHQHFAARERIKRWSDSAENTVIWSGPGRTAAGGGELAAADTPVVDVMAREAFKTINAWVLAIADDKQPGRQIDKVLRNRPAAATDGCWIGGDKPSFVAETQTLGSQGVCNARYPGFTFPRVAAGGPISGDVLKCALKPLRREDYRVRFAPEEWDRLGAAFPTGVCDWSKLGLGQTPVQPWRIWS